MCSSDLAEILKSSLIANYKNFKFLSDNLNSIINIQQPYIGKAILNSCNLKKKIVQKDEVEKNIRKVLNLGHTFAHAYEASLGYSKKLNHGEAVLLGMCSALKFSYQNKFLKKNEFKSVLKHLENSNLNLDIKKFFSQKDLDKILLFMEIGRAHV